eukprot:586146-Prorocentrum_minimum.AAC.2
MKRSDPLQVRSCEVTETFDPPLWMLRAMMRMLRATVWMLRAMLWMLRGIHMALDTLYFEPWMPTGACVVVGTYASSRADANLSDCWKHRDNRRPLQSSVQSFR